MSMNTITRAAQKSNANHMSDGQLLRELRQVASYPERPPIRVAWIETLRDEIAVRGLYDPYIA